MKVVRLNQSISCNEETDISRFLYWMKGDFVMKNFNFWQRWLLVVSWIIVLFGLAMALLNATPIFDFMNDRVNPVFWGDGPVPWASPARKRHLHAVDLWRFRCDRRRLGRAHGFYHPLRVLSARALGA
jgi:hypothetical protein